jgi:glycosyltransferase 2 family protein
VAKLSIIVAFVLSARSFGVDESFARMALLYMTANTVASAAPTPGGVGAIEAALWVSRKKAGLWSMHDVLESRLR